MLTRTLKGHPYMNARVFYSEYGTSELLQSYQTFVLEHKTSDQYGGREWFSCSGLYSATTIKHISLYMRECGLSYYLIKPIAGTDWRLVIGDTDDNFAIRYYNIETAEIIEYERCPDPSFFNRKSVLSWFRD